MGHTPGNWHLGRHADTVVTNRIESINAEHLYHYGGQVIAESVLSEADRHLISAAPDLFEALIEVLKIIEDEEIHRLDALEMADKAIEKARGGKINE